MDMVVVLEYFLTGQDLNTFSSYFWSAGWSRSARVFFRDIDLSI